MHAGRASLRPRLLGFVRFGSRPAPSTRLPHAECKTRSARLRRRTRADHRLGAVRRAGRLRPGRARRAGRLRDRRAHPAARQAAVPRPRACRPSWPTPCRCCSSAPASRSPSTWLVANIDSVLARGPLYQESLLASIQRLAVLLGVETEPTWISLRQDLLAQINVQRVIGSTVVSVTSILVSFVVVFLYASFLLLELRHFPAKLAGLSSDPQRVARIRQVTSDINARIGSYLALKTFLSLLLGAISWVIMTLYGLEFATVLGGPDRAAELRPVHRLVSRRGVPGGDGASSSSPTSTPS